MIYLSCFSSMFGHKTLERSTIVWWISKILIYSQNIKKAVHLGLNTLLISLKVFCKETKRGGLMLTSQHHVFCILQLQLWGGTPRWQPAGNPTPPTRTENYHHQVYEHHRMKNTREMVSWWYDTLYERLVLLKWERAGRGEAKDPQCRKMIWVYLGMVYFICNQVTTTIKLLFKFDACVSSTANF